VSRLLAWPFVFSILAALGSLALVERLWRLRTRPGARWLLGTIAAQSVFCLSYAVALTVGDPTLRYALEVIAVASFCWIGVPFLGFALEYTGRSSSLNSWYFRALFGAPLLTTLLLPFNKRHGLFWIDFSIDPAFGVVGATYTTQPLLFITVLTGTLSAGVGGLLLLETFLDYGPLYRSEAIAVALSPIPPSVGLLAWLFQFGPVPELNVTAILFIPHILLDAYAFIWSDMFEFHPATSRAAERSAIEDLGSPVLVLDEQGRVVDLTGDASDLLAAGWSPITQSIDELLGTDVSLSEGQRYTHQRNGTQRTFQVRPAPLTDSGDNHVGYTLVFQDITEEVRRQQRLDVLNRVLRHNLRNDMTVVKGNVALARDTDDEQKTTAALEAAAATADDLIETSEKARTVAETVRATDEVSPVDIGQRCRDIADRYRERAPEATITVETDPEVRAETDPQLFTAVVANLVENALEHGGDEPTVEISVARRDPGLVCITVADDGPGLPEAELEALRAGEETSLQHGSGFGLWVVKWGAELLGDDVTFDVDESGTTATLCLDE
jgi:signal transduction histidine kinase